MSEHAVTWLFTRSTVSANSGFAKTYQKQYFFTNVVLPVLHAVNFTEMHQNYIL